MASSLFGRDALHPRNSIDIPRGGKVVSAILEILTISVLTICLTRRISATKDWKTMPLSRWITFAVYGDSIVFIITATILDHGFGLNSNITVCSAAILICLTCYLTTKALIFYFLIEKVYIIQTVRKSRLKSKLYCFNCFCMLLPYCAIVILNFVYRVAYFNDEGTCVIGMEFKSVMPLIILDAFINLYLTLLFVVPLRRLYTYKNSPNSKLRTIALRSFIGSCGTLTSSVVNLTVLMVLHGEAAWICLMCCNADILFSVVVLHWVTSKDATTTSTGSANPTTNINPTHSIVVARLSNPTITKTSMHKHHPFSYRAGSDDLKGRQNTNTVTTHISAMENIPHDQDATDELDDLEMGKIRVHVGRVIERETSPGERDGDGDGDGDGEGEVESISTSTVEDAQNRRSHRSTEDLVMKS